MMIESIESTTSSSEENNFFKALEIGRMDSISLKPITLEALSMRSTKSYYSSERPKAQEGGISSFSSKI